MIFNREFIILQMFPRRAVKGRFSPVQFHSVR